jgi:hypothetical protein
MRMSRRSLSLIGGFVLGPAVPLLAAGSALPIPLESYHDAPGAGLWSVLRGRLETVPFNGVALAIFLLAIAHTFLTARFRHWAHEAEAAYAAARRGRPGTPTRKAMAHGPR